MGLREEIQLLLSARDTSPTAIRDFQQNLIGVRTVVGELTTAMAEHEAAVGRLAGAYDGLGRTLDGQIARFRQVRDAMVATTAAVDAQRASLANLALGYRYTTDAAAGLGAVPAGGAALGADANLVAGRRVAATRAAEADLLRARGIGGIAGRVAGAPGLTEALGGAFFSPAGLAALGIGYAGYATIRAGADYQSAIAQTVSQYTTSPGQAAAVTPTLTQGILDYVASGRSPYSATTIATSIEPLLAHGYSTQAALQALPAIAALSAQNRAPDLGTAINLINSLTALGPGPAATGKQLTGYADLISRAETLTTIPPGQATLALPRLLSGVLGTGITPEEAIGAYLKVGTANPSARLDATSLVRLISDITTKPTAGAQREAGALGIPIGPGAIEQYGGIFGYLQAVQTATAGPNQRKLLSGLFTQTNALQAFYDLTQGGGISQAVGYTGQLQRAGGATATAQQTFSLGIEQQATQLQNKLNADMTTLGLTLNRTVTPALLKLADGAVLAAEGFAKAAAAVFAGPGGQGGIGASLTGALMTLTELVKNPGAGLDAARARAGADLAGATARQQSIVPPAGSGILPVVGGQGQYAYEGRVYPSLAAAEAARAGIREQATAMSRVYTGGAGPGGRPAGLSIVTPSGGFLAQATGLPVPAVPGAALSEGGQGLARVYTGGAGPGGRPATVHVVLDAGGAGTFRAGEIGDYNQAARQAAALATMAPHDPNTAVHTAQLGVQAADRQFAAALRYSDSVTLQQRALADDVAARQRLIDAQKLTGDTLAGAESSLAAYAQSGIDQINAKFTGWLNQQRSILGKDVTIAQLSGGDVGRANAALQAFDRRYGAYYGVTGQDLTIQGLSNRQAAAQTGLGRLMEQQQLAQLQNNPTALAAIVGATVSYIRANASVLYPGDKVAAQLAIAQEQQLLTGARTVLPGPQLIRPQLAGLGEVGFGTSIAHLAGAPGGAAQTIALLREQVARQDAVIAQLREMVAYLRQVAQGTTQTAVHTRPRAEPLRTRGTHHLGHHHRLA